MRTRKWTSAPTPIQIWKNAIDRDPSLQKIIRRTPRCRVLDQTHVRIAEQPEGVLVYVRTAEGNDALAWVDKHGNSVTRIAVCHLQSCRVRT